MNVCPREEGALWPDAVPKRSGENARDKQGQPAQQVEDSVGRPAQLRRSRVSDKGREQSLRRTPYATPTMPHQQPRPRFHP